MRAAIVSLQPQVSELRSKSTVTNMFNPMLPNNIPADLSEQAVTITSISCMQHLFIDTTSFFLEA